MPEGQIMGIERPFVEDSEDTLKLIIEFAQSITAEDVRREAEIIHNDMDEKGLLVSDMRVDEGVTHFLVIEMATTNMKFTDIAELNGNFAKIEGYKGLTVSTVDIGGIDRLMQKR